MYLLRQAVEDGDLVATRREFHRQTRADETRSPGNEYFHNATLSILGSLGRPYADELPTAAQQRFYGQPQ